MTLNPTQKQYLEHETFTRWREVLDAYFKERDSFRTPSPEDLGLSVDQVEAVRIRKLATDLIDVRVSSFIDVYRKFGKFPKEDEYRAFIEQSRTLIVENSMKLFEDACKDIFRPATLPTIANAIRRSLPEKLQIIFSNGIRPATSFFLEGKAMAEEKSMEKSYDETAFEILGVLKENGVNETMKISELASRVGLPEDEVWIYLKGFQNRGWIGLRMGGVVDLYFEGAEAYLRAKSRSNESTTGNNSGDTYHTHNYGPSNNQIGGSGNIQIVRNINPDIASVLTAILELVRESDLSELDKEEVFEVAKRLNSLSEREQTPEVVERKKKWFDWLATAIQVGELSTKAAPLIEQLGRALGL